MDFVVTTLLNALTLISILMLVGLGLAISFGLMNVTNLAHGEFVTVGAFAVYFVQSIGGSFWLG
ncbi:MAG: branched-chain amino acid ABC transporter permease, partial [Mesorhizobium sp.]